MLIKDLYSIEQYEYEDKSVNARVKLNPDHPVFKGHFPGNPVMPGVCTIQLVKELTEKAIGKELFLTVASNIKFMAIINPEKNDTIDLMVQITQVDQQIKVKNTVHFEDTLALKLSATFKILD